MGMCHAIRDLTVAAPLKRAWWWEDDTAVPSIRDLTVAAPLKLGLTGDHVAFRRRPIRDLTVAAPLKLGKPHRHGYVPCYPRPNGRGPIEAGMVVGRRYGCPIYPRPNGRGPIEALGSEDQTNHQELSYPRPNGRGPIEACVHPF